MSPRNRNLTGRLLRTLFGLCLLITASTGQAIERVTFYHNDALGSRVAATDATGTLLWRQSYAPYGKRLTKEAGSRDTVWYTGKPEEAAFGLSYFGARWYDPTIGRFLAMDPVGFDPGNIQSFNRYAYANDNPYKYLDPDGNSPLDIGFFIADSIKFAIAVNSGNPAAIQSAAADLAGSAIGLLSPVPGTGQLIKGARAGSKLAKAAKGTIPRNKSLSTIRQAGPNETFVRFESADVRFSKVTTQGGLKPGTFAAPTSELPVPLSQRVTRFNLPDPQIPRTRQLDIQAPGDSIIGPRPVSGGTGNEVLFPFGTKPGTVK